MGIVIVDVCMTNRITELNVEEILEQEFPEVAVVMNDCLSYCGLCANGCYALVNGKIVHGKTPEQCLDNIRERIKKELAVFQ